jgi:hypothetical protein
MSRLLVVAGLCAIFLGLSVITATVLAVDALRGDGSPANRDLLFSLLAGGTVSGILLAAYAAWKLLEPLPSLYRRGALSIVCAFATVLLMLICMPVNQLMGRTGLYVMLVVCLLAAALLAPRAWHWRRKA